MYKPTENERINCIRIVKDILEVDSDLECEKYINDIFNTTYSIGGDYNEETLRHVAEVLLKQNSI